MWIVLIVVLLLILLYKMNIKIDKENNVIWFTPPFSNKRNYIILNF